MKSVSSYSAHEAPPPPQDSQAARIAARVSVSPAVAAAIAGFAWGLRRRDDDVLLMAMTSTRVASYTEARS